MITIYGSDGIAKAQIATDDNSTQVKEIQGDNILTLSFTLYEHIALEVNDYTEFQGERYWLMEQYKPEQLSTVEWKYDVKLYGIESLLKRFLVLNDTDGDDEPVFTLTAPPREHVALIVKSINNGMNNTTDWKVGTVEGTENIVIDYEGKYCDEALKEVAEKAGNRAEWWCEGQTVNVCRCEHGEEVTLAYGKGLTSLECDMADNVKFYTRLYPIGSSRNIDPERYGHSRLQLPNGEKHIDVNVEKYGIWHHYEADAFADIYPKRIGTVTGVRSEQVTGEDGNPFKIYYFRDDSMGFDPNDYEIGGKVKRVSFQEGSELAGLGDEENGTYYFEVNFNSDTREFEIITIWPYDDDTQLPNDTLIPKVGDKYILWNIRMPDEYYPLAEQEFKQAVDKYNEEHAIDVSCYKSPTDHVYIEEHGIDLYIGRRVRLESTKYFPETGFRNSRITKVTRKVNQPSQMDIEISDATSTGTMEAISDSITDAKNYVKTATSGSFPDLIRCWDNTYPTDNNVFSARRTLKEALSRLREDTAQEKIRFLKGADFGKYEAGGSGATVDGDGNAEWLTAVIRELLRSVKFVDGMFGEGWQLWMDALTGLSNLTIDKVTIRQTLVALELLIQKVRSIGGQFVVSAASGKIKTVAKDGDNYKITFEQDNEFVAHDLMRCAEFTGASLRGYWVEVSASDGNGITVPVSEFGGVEPKEGDECVLMGNTQNRLRQNLISIAATEDGQPRVDVLDGVCAKNFNGCLRVRLGNLDGISDSRFPADNQPHGNGLYGDNVYLMGTFVLTTGEDILTRFEITEGKIEAAVEGLRKDFTEDKSYLDNASFGNGMNKWDTENEATFFLLGSKWIWANGAPLSDKTNYATVKTDDGRTTVFIRNKYILQKHENFRFIPDYNDINDEGQKKPEAVYLSFFYRVAKAGRMIIKFEGLDKSGFENFNEFSYDGELDVTDGYQIFNHSGLWNGTGDFKLSFTGEIYLYMLVLSTDRAEALAYKYKTLFEQSEKLVKIAAANFDKDGNVIETSSIVTTAKYNELMSQYFDENGVLKNQAGLVTTAMANKLYAFDADGNIVSMINQTASDIKISAKNISLEGLVTANSNFKILENGSIETIKATIKKSELTDVIINGTLRTPFRDGYYVLSADGPLTVSTLGLQNNNNVVIPIPGGGWQTAVVIPFSSEYNGFRAIIMNDNWGADTSGGTLTHTAPSGKYYFENGVKKNTLEIPRNSGVEIIGYGEGDNFKGWIVLNRIYKSDHDNGFPLHVMFYGMVRNDSLVKIKKYHDENITFSKIGTGKYRITFGQAFSDKNNYTVLLTGFAEGTGRYASVSAQETTYFDVYTGDDESPNDGGFQFLVINTAAMYV